MGKFSFNMQSIFSSLTRGKKSSSFSPRSLGNKNSIIIGVMVSLVFCLVAPITTFAVIPPDLTFGITSGYSVYGHAGITNADAGTRVWGNVGDNNVGHAGFTVVQVPSGIIDTSTANGTAIENDASSVYDSLMDASQGVPSALNLAGTHTTGNGNPITPGVYNVGATTLNGAVELSGAGVYIFRSDSSLTIATSGGSMTLTNGASACNVFWAVPASMTIGTGSQMAGTIIAQTGLISLATGANLLGRAISLISQVTLDNNQITQPTCGPLPGTLHIIKHVITNNGGSATASQFTINVAGTNVSSSSFAGSEAGVDVTLDAGSYAVTEPVVPSGYLESGSGTCSGTIASGQTITCTITNDDIAPQLIVNKVIVNDNGGTKLLPANFSFFIDGSPVISGVTTTTTIGLHTISETPDSAYEATIAGNCAADGTITLALGDVKTCTITNNDNPVAPGSFVTYVVVPPLIDVVKVPSPLALPNGPGPVTYTYTLRNIGTVPVTNVTMVGDTCSPIILNSGDTNGDSKLDVNETWIYRCSTTLLATHTNIVTATGQANGITATDIASATVVVGLPVVPPLIHVTKIPNPLALPAGSGMVTYTNKVTNPGTVALSNVHITDDKCGAVQFISGDTNGDSKLDTTETWTYSCTTTLFKTTTNTVTATGQANGLTATDFAIATVIVSAPGFPNTGLPDASGFGQQVKVIAIDLRQGSVGNNVTFLQQFLISKDKGLAAKALSNHGTTTYFGVLTRAALAEFQASVGINPPMGYFGPITRAYLKANY